jgi:alpha-beta hydrolase superfamily lysophospholipase
MPSLFDSPGFNQTLFYPRADLSPAPSGSRDVAVPVPGGVLNLRIHSAPSARFALLLFHGNGETAPDYDGAASLFARCGAALAVMDYRGYGRGEGEPVYRSTLKTDVRAAVEALAACDARPIVIMGRSLGSACLAELYPDPPPRAAGFIWESGFTDLAALIRRRGLEPPGSFPPEDLADFDPVPRLRQGQLPFFALHGAEDIHISPSDSRTACEAAGGSRKRMVLIPGKGHNDLSASPRYWQAIADFLSELA